MIQYVPIERAPALGRWLEFVLCSGVPGHARGRGDFRGKGMAAWGLALPFWMRASWFRRHGYRRADRRGLSVLVWKPFAEDAEAPRWLPETGRRPEPLAGKVCVTGCVNGWCPAQNLAFERARRAAAPHGSLVECRVVDTSDRETMLAWGESDALFVDGHRIRTGPPPSQAKLDALLARQVRRLGRGAATRR